MNPSPLARVLRRKSTWAEKKLWVILRDRRFSAYKFRRQHKMGSYYLDFFVLKRATTWNWTVGNTVFRNNRRRMRSEMRI